MSLLLCRQKAGRPFCHDKLNINIWSEQELCYIIYNYPLLCLGDFCTEGLFEWIDTELHLKKLADRLKDNLRTGELFENQLLLILQECNYYDLDEVMEFGKRIAEYRKFSDYELTYMKGKALYKSGNYNAAYEKFEQAIRRLEAEYRRSKQNDDKELRDHNERKADIYCDMASLKMQMFDEKSAAELIEMSLMTCSNKRANELKYLIDGSGELSDERKAELDLKKDAVRAAARESAAYKEIEAIFRKDKMTLFKEARKLAAGWKSGYRKNKF